jgi:hypothetical protein
MRVNGGSAPSVRACEQFQRAEAANRLIRIPTGDGMVLVFYTNPENYRAKDTIISFALPN